jgi:Complex 1 protein (LYR family)
MPPKLWIPGSVSQSPLIHHITDKIRRAEALSLYREILRTAKHFHWADEKSGKPWNKLLRAEARKEFEESRRETDPLIVARMLVTGRDCLQQVQNKFNAATAAAWKRIEKDSCRHAAGSARPEDLNGSPKSGRSA